MLVLVSENILDDLLVFCTILLVLQLRSWTHWLGGDNIFLSLHLGGGVRILYKKQVHNKTSVVNNPVWGANSCRFFIWGALPPAPCPPSATCLLYRCMWHTGPFLQWGAGGCHTPADKCSVGKLPNLPFLLAKLFTFLCLCNIRRRIICCSVTVSSLIRYVFPRNLLM